MHNYLIARPDKSSAKLHFPSRPPPASATDDDQSLAFDNRRERVKWAPAKVEIGSRLERAGVRNFEETSLAEIQGYKRIFKWKLSWNTLKFYERDVTIQTRRQRGSPMYCRDRSIF